MGQRITGMTSGQKSFPCVAPMFKFAQHGQCGALDQRAVAAHGPHRRRHCHHQVDEHRGDQSRSGHHVYPDRQPAAGPAQPGRLAQLRPGQREREPAGLRGDDLAGQQRRPTISRCSRGCGAAASCPRSIRACVSARATIPVLYLSNPPGIDREPAAARCSTAWAI